MEAGLNQIDILEAVIEKVLAEEQARGSTRQVKSQIVFDLIQAGLGADAATNPAFERLVDPTNLDKYFDASSQEILT